MRGSRVRVIAAISPVLSSTPPVRSLLPAPGRFSRRHLPSVAVLSLVLHCLGWRWRSTVGAATLSVYIL
ncbi:hypothetical protein BDA96_10G135600 [Sorghum bicolor]|uniref:Uncharacterized protein n=2 Tax=Sorghum bicolor TaxID=4558 RepID=A0A1W0VSH9_SORBI|nr:hypothetical protein BDA96_10G135600 [Sorghum bicolor]OQU76210.1 hypothetical protein SORBI_3010G111300 [Sorghum bicolor]OQU76211.1 hypothetical protein SORBI_3010G111300 [Sorghum bicolor]